MTGPDDANVEREWQEFWRPIVAPNGVVLVDQVKKELFDFSKLLHEVGVVYDHVTGGSISKPHTSANHVIAAADEHYVGSAFGDEALEVARRVAQLRRGGHIALELADGSDVEHFNRACDLLDHLADILPED